MKTINQCSANKTRAANVLCVVVRTVSRAGIPDAGSDVGSDVDRDVGSDVDPVFHVVN